MTTLCKQGVQIVLGKASSFQCYSHRARDWFGQVPQIIRHFAYPEVPLRDILNAVIEEDALGTITEWSETPSLCVGDIIFLWFDHNGEGMTCHPIRITEWGFEYFPIEKLPAWFRGGRLLRLQTALTTLKP